MGYVECDAGEENILRERGGMWLETEGRERGGKEVELNFEEADLFSVSSSMPLPDFFPTSPMTRKSPSS